MHIYLYTYICIYTYTHIYAYTPICIYVHVHLYTYRSSPPRVTASAGLRRKAASEREAASAGRRGGSAPTLPRAHSHASSSLVRAGAKASASMGRCGGLAPQARAGGGSVCPTPACGPAPRCRLRVTLSARLWRVPCPDPRDHARGRHPMALGRPGGAGRVSAFTLVHL
jgi:hypothetical protein